MNPSAPDVRLEDLVEHCDQLDAQVTLMAAQTEFIRRKRRFLGVSSGGKFCGVACAQEITGRLSLQFGHALFGRAIVREHLMLNTLVFTPDTPLTDVLKLASARHEREFYHDIALVSREREFIGMIPVHSLVRLQTSLLLNNLVEVKKQRRELRASNRRMEEDLRMAREVQLALLPGEVTRMQYAGNVIETDYIYEPAELIGGDFFSVFSPGPGLLACCICDVMGHGVRPALITAILRAMIEESQTDAHDPGPFLSEMNRSFKTMLRRIGDLIFVTVGFGVIDLARAKLYYSQAGHPNPFLWRAERGAAEELMLEPDSAGPALGLMDDFAYVTTETDFRPGDELLLYTDGIHEVTASDGREFGTHRLLYAYNAAHRQGRSDIAPALLGAARRFSGSQSFPDDVCLLVARFAGTGTEDGIMFVDETVGAEGGEIGSGNAH